MLEGGRDPEVREDGRERGREEERGKEVGREGPERKGREGRREGGNPSFARALPPTVRLELRSVFPRLVQSLCSV